MQTDALTPITLPGRGLVERGGDYYEPGEYSKFQNLEITPQGTIKKRISAQGYQFNSFGGSSIDRFIGNYEEHPVIAYYEQPLDMTFLRTTDEISFKSSGNTNYDVNFKNPVLATAALDANHVNRTISIEGYFKYNSDQYVIANVSGWYSYVGTFNNMTSYQHKVVICKADGSTYDYFHNDLGLYNTRALAFSIDPTDFRTSDLDKVVLRQFIACFLFHKDRLLIAAEDTLYMSKATDPMTFTPASGGAFFKFPNKRINKVVAIGDNIYIIFDSSISVLTYNTDPNTDGQVRVISDAVGGEDAVVYGDTIYVVRAGDIYTINGTNVTKLVDINAKNMRVSTDPQQHSDVINNNLGSSAQVKCAAYDGSLYIINRICKKVPGSVNKNNIYYEAVASDTYPSYRLNIETGVLTRLKYQADAELPLSDILYIPVQGRQHDKIVLMSRRAGNVQKHVFHHSKGNRFRYNALANSFYEDLSSGHYGIDMFSSSDGNSFVTYPIPIELTLQGISPEHLRYMVHKFRSLQMEAALPLWHHVLPSEATDPELELIVDAGRALSNVVTGAGNLVVALDPTVKTGRIDPDGGTSESPVYGNVDTYRFGFNQRAKSITITIRTRDEVMSLPGVMGDYLPASGGADYVQKTFFELVDLAVLWTPTRRGPTNKRDSFL